MARLFDARVEQTPGAHQGCHAHERYPEDKGTPASLTGVPDLRCKWCDRPYFTLTVLVALLDDE